MDLAKDSAKNRAEPPRFERRQEQEAGAGQARRQKAERRTQKTRCAGGGEGEAEPHRTVRRQSRTPLLASLLLEMEP